MLTYRIVYTNQEPATEPPQHAHIVAVGQEAIQMRIQDWVERYLEVESLFPEEQHAANLPLRKVTSLDEIETAAAHLFQQLRGNAWHRQGAWKTLSITF